MGVCQQPWASALQTTHRMVRRMCFVVGLDAGRRCRPSGHANGAGPHPCPAGSSRLQGGRVGRSVEGFVPCKNTRCGYQVAFCWPQGIPLSKGVNHGKGRRPRERQILASDQKYFAACNMYFVCRRWYTTWGTRDFYMRINES